MTEEWWREIGFLLWQLVGSFLDNDFLEKSFVMYTYHRNLNKYRLKINFIHYTK